MTDNPKTSGKRTTDGKPFLLAVCRPAGPIATDERQTIVDYGGLDTERDLHDVWLIDKDGPDPADLDLERDYSGVIITGSHFGFGHEPKSPEQELVEGRVLALAGRVVAEDIPTLGICFGLQAIAKALGDELVDGFAEDLQAPRVTLTDDAERDPLARNMPRVFWAYAGHAESVGNPPAGGVVLATGDFCHTQMVRWGRNVYGTQFHPEITTPGMRIRIDSYGDTYYPAHEKAAVIERCDAADVTGGNRLITEFVSRYKR
ncbi:MAG: glutamine amidotransferase [Actinomycetaceae bacterium]|nr:glutamine amidotransferase [Actinomycetaceae bacterium]